jgi:hypothetical protein
MSLFSLLFTGLLEKLNGGFMCHALIPLPRIFYLPCWQRMKALVIVLKYNTYCVDQQVNF